MEVSPAFAKKGMNCLRTCAQVKYVMLYVAMGPPNDGHTLDPTFCLFVEKLSSFGGYFA